MDRDAAPYDQALEQARSRWAAVVVSRDDLEAWVSEHATPAQDIAALKLSDVVLALACARGDPAAITAFEETYRKDIEATFARFRDLPTTLDEVRQRVRDKLFVGPKPKIAEYTGTGDLRSWLRVVVTRMLINVSARETREQAVPDEELLAALPASASDPEAAHLERVYGAVLRETFGDAIRRLTAREKNLLSYAVLDDLGVDAIGTIYGVHRATAARWLVAARETLHKELRAALMARVPVRPSELDSLLRSMLERVEITVERYLR